MVSARQANRHARIGEAVFVVLCASSLRPAAMRAAEAPSAEAARVSLSRQSGLPLEARAAVMRAYESLEDPRCRQIFLDFRDPWGRTLQQRLDSLGQTGQTYLAEMIFSDGSDREACLFPLTLATTTPGHRVVFVCGSKFKARARRDFHGLAVVILHEELHSLGLGENPPTSQEISQRIAERCH